MPRSVVVATLLLLDWAGAPLALAQIGKSVQIVRVAHGPRIDGRLDDPMWAQAARVTDVTQFAPGSGAPPSEGTEFLIAYDDDNLYIGARLLDSEPAKIKHSQLVQGQAVFNDDYIQILLDPYNNKRTGYIFYVNPNGVQRDGLLFGGLMFNMDWDGIWDAMADIGPDGWTAEMALPFKTLAFDPRSDVWGLNLIRSIRRKREEIAWNHNDRRITLDAAGEIHGLRDLKRGQGLDVVPSVAFSQREQFSSGRSNFLPKPSVDAFYRITPALTAALTVNTDFSATDVDDRQVNLTRFSLFFPEKRDFFLEGAEIFEFGGFGGSTQNGRPFFSRTIGLSATGQPIDIDVGAKLTGKVGDVTVGALAVRQEQSGVIPAQDLFVGRAYVGLFEQSAFGGIVTIGDPTADRSSKLIGLDLNLRDQKLLKGKVIDTKWWVQRSDTEGLDGDDAAYGVALAYPNDDVDLYAGLTEIQQNFRPALGFVNRTGIRQYEARAKYRYRYDGKDHWFRSWLGGVDLFQVDGRSGGLQSRRLALTPFTLDTQPGDQVQVDLIRSTEVLQLPFFLPGGLRVAPGRYDFDRARFNAVTAGFRRVSATLDFETGDFYDGRRRDTRVAVQWRPSSHLFVNAQYQTNDISLPSGEFTARTYSLAGNVAFNVNWAWLNVAQYDNISRRLGVNSRLRWLPAAGQAAYLVVNYDWREDLNGNFQPFFAETTLKFNYTFRF
jgi:hypothetical protein